jgi:hypothetical protein
MSWMKPYGGTFTEPLNGVCISAISSRASADRARQRGRHQQL